MEPVKWTVVKNIRVELDGRQEVLHRELDWPTEQEADDWCVENEGYEKIPVYRG